MALPHSTFEWSYACQMSLSRNLFHRRMFFFHLSVRTLPRFSLSFVSFFLCHHFIAPYITRRPAIVAFDSLSAQGSFLLIAWIFHGMSQRLEIYTSLDKLIRKQTGSKSGLSFPFSIASVACEILMFTQFTFFWLSSYFISLFVLDLLTLKYSSRCCG